MGKWIGKAGGCPPYPILEMLGHFEAVLATELDSKLPNSSELQRLQEQIEDAAEDLDIHIEWFSIKDHLVADLCGKCLGSYHFTMVDYDKLSASVTGSR